MSGQTLRALSRTYADGDIDRETYRLQRRELLDGIVAGSVELERFEPPEPESPTVFPYDDDDGDTTQEILPPYELDSANSGSRLWWLGVGALALIAVVAWFAFRPSATAPTATVRAEISEATKTNLIDSFVGSDNWSRQAISSLTMAWQALDTESQTQLRNSPSMGAMRQAILSQIDTENALINLGDKASGLENQSFLFDLADDLGIADQRIGRAREAWEAQQDTSPASNSPAIEGDEKKNRANSANPPALDDSVAALNQSTDESRKPGEAVAAQLADELTTELLSDERSSGQDPVAAPQPESTPKANAALDNAASPTATTSATPATLRSNCAAELARKRRPYCIDVLQSGIKGPVLVVLAPGSFEMGGDGESEKPRHNVSIDYPFAIGLFEVSVAELQQYCDLTATPCPAQPWQDNALPAVNLDHQTASAYAAWLSQLTGAQYRLPSEAEWEYAARGGVNSSYPLGEEIQPAHAVFSFRAVLESPKAANDRSVNRNGFRLYHMVGNVREWVMDGWRGNYQGHPNDGSAIDVSADRDHVVRGGSYADHAEHLRTAARVRIAAGSSDRFTGFRVVRAITQ